MKIRNLMKKYVLLNHVFSKNIFIILIFFGLLRKNRLLNIIKKQISDYSGKNFTKIFVDIKAWIYYIENYHLIQKNV